MERRISAFAGVAGGVFGLVRRGGWTDFEGILLVCWCEEALDGRGAVDLKREIGVWLGLEDVRMDGCF